MARSTVLQRARPRIDVLLPVRGGRRSLPFAVRDLLAQRDVEVRIIAIVDTAASALDTSVSAASASGAYVPAADADASRDWLHACARSERRLLVLDGPGRGPGPALDVGLAAVETEVFAQMEADDRCPPHRLALLHAARDPRLHEPPDAVVSRAAQFGARTPGMRRYLDWQNALLTDDAMADARFVEIPALHQTGLYATAAVRALGGYTPAGPWPLDIDFWMRWFEPDRDGARRLVLKLPRVLYRWRQHPRQSTRTGATADGTHSLAALRACKVHYLARLLASERAPPLDRTHLPERDRERGGERAAQRPLLLLSTGATLPAWEGALRSAGLDVAHSVAWRAGQPLPAVLREFTSRALILAVYGMAPAREALRAALRAAPPGADAGDPRAGEVLLFAG